jgi:hypothetical protein
MEVLKRLPHLKEEKALQAEKDSNAVQDDVTQDDDGFFERLPEYSFDLLDAAQQLLRKLDGISTTDFSEGADASERETLRRVIEQITGTTEFVPRLSSEQYAARRGDCCPRCLSTFLSGEAVPRPERGIIERSVHCRSCAAHWLEVYGLEGYRDLQH